MKNEKIEIGTNGVIHYSWFDGKKQNDIKLSIGYEIFIRMYIATLLGGEFSNTHGQGSTPEGAISSLKIRLIQLRNK